MIWLTTFVLYWFIWFLVGLLMVRPANQWELLFMPLFFTAIFMGPTWAIHTLLSLFL